MPKTKVVSALKGLREIRVFVFLGWFSVRDLGVLYNPRCCGMNYGVSFIMCCQTLTCPLSNPQDVSYTNIPFFYYLKIKNKQENYEILSRMIQSITY